MSTQMLKTVQGTSAPLDETTINSLRVRVRGPVLLPADPGYDAARAIWNGMINRRPGVIVRCTGTADVIEAVKFAREHGLLVSVRAGGHNIAGLSIAEGGVMIDLTPMKGVVVDPHGRRAVAQAGCTLGNLDRETQVHGLATVLGFVSLTGAARLTLGGGFGYLTRKHGWASDNLLSAEMVAADGRVVRASERENPDLLWALRGGGGNFGIVTSLEYQLHPVGPRIMGGIILHPIDQAEKLLRFFRELTSSAPRELTAVFLCRPAPALPWVPTEWHGRPVAALVVCHSGALDQARRDLAPIKAWGHPIVDQIVEKAYCDQQMMLDATQPSGRHYYWKSEWIPGISDEMIPVFLERARSFPSPFSLILLFHVAGAIGERPADATAVGNRDAVFNLTFQAAWDAGPKDVPIGWARESWRAVRRFSTGGVYVNFLTEEEGRDRVAEAYKENFDRLARVKGKWDPGNFFRTNQNITPAL